MAHTIRSKVPVLFASSMRTVWKMNAKAFSFLHKNGCSGEGGFNPGCKWDLTIVSGQTCRRLQRNRWNRRICSVSHNGLSRTRSGSTVRHGSCSVGINIHMNMHR